MLQDRILAYITKSNGLVSLEKLVSVGGSAGFSESEILAAITGLGKKLKAVARGNDLYYQLAPEPKVQPMEHLTWIRSNYPWPGKNGIPKFVMPWPEWDLSWIFLTPEELVEYKAQAKNVPKHMLNLKHGKKTRG